MLGEVVVVSSVVAAVLVTMFIAINRLSSAYETRNTYYDIDAAYLAGEVNDYLIRKKIINNLIENASSGLISAAGDRSSDLLEQQEEENLDDAILLKFKDTNNCNLKVYFSLFASDTDTLEKLRGLNYVTNTFKDYIDYLQGNIDFTEDYTYMIIVEMQDRNNYDNCRYYCLKVR